MATVRARLRPVLSVTPTAAAVASTSAARERPDATSTATGTCVGKAIPGRSVEMLASETAVRYDERFVKWIPVVVPLLALLLAVGTYFILGMVIQ